MYLQFWWSYTAEFPLLWPLCPLNALIINLSIAAVLLQMNYILKYLLNECKRRWGSFMLKYVYLFQENRGVDFIEHSINLLKLIHKNNHTSTLLLRNFRQIRHAIKNTQNTLSSIFSYHVVNPRYQKFQNIICFRTPSTISSRSLFLSMALAAHGSSVSPPKVAMIRVGPPLPPPIFIGITLTVAPLSGSRPRFFTFSSP